MREGTSSDTDLRLERAVAASRILLAAVGLLAAWLDQAESVPDSAAFVGLLAAYGLFALGCAGWLLVRRHVSRRFCMAVHIVDVAVAAALVQLAPGPRREALFFVSYPMLVAAYRWGLRETLWTGLTAVAVVSIQFIAYMSTHANVLQVLGDEMGAMRPMTRAAYIVTLGLLVGYLADTEKRQRREAQWISGMLQDSRAGAPLDETYARVLARVAQQFRATRVLLVLHDSESRRTFVRPFEAALESLPRWHQVREVPHERRGDYVFGLPGTGVFGALEKGDGTRLAVTAVDAYGDRLASEPITVPSGFLREHPFRTVVAGCAEFEGRWTARVFVFDPPQVWHRASAARLAQRMVAQVGPAMYDHFLLRQLRSRAADAERGRIARELHDGLMQSLMGVEMGLAVLARKADVEAPRLVTDVSELHGVLTREVAALRDVFEGARAVAVPSRPIAQDLSEMVARFGALTGLDALFTAHGSPLVLAPRVRRELLRIVNEALANVRRHSGAAQVTVSTRVEYGRLTVRIEDDGRGFPFTGVRQAEELRAEGRGPWTILGRLRAIDGDLTITSRPGAGAVLDVSVPIEQVVGVAV